jgi:hypothetical protein
MQKVYNVESLFEGDLKTYETLHDIIEYNPDKSEGFEYELYKIENYPELKNFFRDAISDAQKGYQPILHFDLHGNKGGIQLRSGQLINWNKISDHFIELNIACNINLFLSVGACFGIGLIQIIDFLKRAPFRILIGPNQEVYPEQINKLYRGLYEEYLGNGTIENFLKGTDLIPSVFSAIEINHIYNHKLFDVDLSKRNGTFNEFFEHWKVNIFKDSANYSNKNLKEIFYIWFHLNSEKAKATNFEKFFMFDIYPENEKRFSLG